MRELTIEEMERVDGGVVWFGAAAGAIYGGYMAYESGGGAAAIIGGAAMGAATGVFGGVAGATTGFGRLAFTGYAYATDYLNGRFRESAQAGSS